MLRLLADENFDNDIVRGALRHRPAFNVLRAQDVGLSETDDPDVLAWTAREYTGDRGNHNNDPAAAGPFVCNSAELEAKHQPYDLSPARQILHSARRPNKMAEALGGALKSYRLPAAAEALGLAPETDEEAFRSKRLYVLRRIEGSTEAALLELASAIAAKYSAPELADLVMEVKQHAEHRVSRLTRRETLKATDGRRAVPPYTSCICTPRSSMKSWAHCPRATVAEAAEVQRSDLGTSGSRRARRRF